MKALTRYLIDLPRQRLYRAGHDVPIVLYIIAWIQILAALLFIAYLAYLFASAAADSGVLPEDIVV